MLPDIHGTYVLLLHNEADRTVQVGRWREISFDKGYYLYVGSAFGPGGVRARVGRHMREAKSLRWHIDYLRDATDAIAVWVQYGKQRMEHVWASKLLQSDTLAAVDGFGCSDCKCLSHLFYSSPKPSDKSMRSVLTGDLRYMTPVEFGGDER